MTDVRDERKEAALWYVVCPRLAIRLDGRRPGRLFFDLFRRVHPQILEDLVVS